MFATGIFDKMNEVDIVFPVPWEAKVIVHLVIIRDEC